MGRMVLAISLFALLLSAGCPALAAPAPSVPPSPFEGLEAGLRKAARAERAKLEAAGRMKDGLERETPLDLLRQNLHDIRNHRAFWEMWTRWGWSKPELEVLYVGSGAHLAPLVFLHGKTPLKRATYTYTEVNPFCAMRIEVLLATMVRAGLYQDLAAAAGPVPGSRFAERWEKERGKGAGPTRDVAGFTRWLVAAAEEMGIPPSFVAQFRFRRGPTQAEIRLFVRVPDTRPESAPYFNLSDLEAADLAITHDWDHEPRGNLRVLLDFVESYWAGSRAKPLAVMMEDLRKHPFPVEMGFFHPVAESDSGYGHQEYRTWSDGTKAEVEDGAALYGGGVVLQPDMAYLGSLSRSQRTDLFNFALFGETAFEARNVDVIGGKRVVAPALLDLGSGYAMYDVRGEDLRGRDSFLSDLARTSSGLPAASPPLPESLRPVLCRQFERFGEALRGGEVTSVEALVSQAEKDLKDNPFVRSGASRKKLHKFLGESVPMGRLLEAKKSAYATALEALSGAEVELRPICRTPERSEASTAPAPQDPVGP